MKREVREFKRNSSVFPEVVVMDVRDIFHGNYSVEKYVEGGGYESVYLSPSLEKCVERAKQLFDKM